MRCQESTNDIQLSLAARTGVPKPSATGLGHSGEICGDYEEIAATGAVHLYDVDHTHVTVRCNVRIAPPGILLA